MKLKTLINKAEVLERSIDVIDLSVFPLQHAKAVSVENINLGMNYSNVIASKMYQIQTLIKYRGTDQEIFNIAEGIISLLKEDE